MKGKISILFNEKGLRIELQDEKSSTEFLTINLNQEQVCQAMSRLAYTHCEFEVKNLNHVGKTMEFKHVSLELPRSMSMYAPVDKKYVNDLVLSKFKNDPDGWIPDMYFGSHDSFYTENGKYYVRFIVRRYI